MDNNQTGKTYLLNDRNPLVIPAKKDILMNEEPRKGNFFNLNKIKEMRIIPKAINVNFKEGEKNKKMPLTYNIGQIIILKIVPKVPKEE